MAPIRMPGFVGRARARRGTASPSAGTPRASPDTPPPVRSHPMVRSPTGFPLGPILPARLSRMNQSQSRRDRVSGLDPARGSRGTSPSRSGRASRCAPPSWASPLHRRFQFNSIEESVPKVSGSLGLGFRLGRSRSGLANPAANSSACFFARVQSRCPSERASLRPFSRHSTWNRPVLGSGNTLTPLRPLSPPPNPSRSALGEGDR